MRYLQFDDYGKVISFCSAESDIDPGSLPNCMIQAPDEMNSMNFSEYFVEKISRRVIHAGTPPSFFHRFDIERTAWVFDREALIQNSNNLINSKRIDLLNEKVAFMGNDYDADGFAVSNIQSTLTMCANGVQLPENFTWRDAQNNNVPMSLEKLKGLARTIFERNTQVYAESWALKDSLASKSDEELLALYNDLTNK